MIKMITYRDFTAIPDHSIQTNFLVGLSPDKVRKFTHHPVAIYHEIPELQIEKIQSIIEARLARNPRDTEYLIVFDTSDIKTITHIRSFILTYNLFLGEKAIPIDGLNFVDFGLIDKYKKSIKNYPHTKKLFLEKVRQIGNAHLLNFHIYYFK